MVILSAYFRKLHPYAERFFDFSNILTLQQINLDMKDRFMPRYSLATISYPVLNGKKCLFMQILPPHINQNGSA